MNASLAALTHLSTLAQPTGSDGAAIRVLGIDPGLNITGYGVIDFGHDPKKPAEMRLVEAGIVRSRAKNSLQSRINEIYSGVREVLDQHNPDVMALEQLFSHYSRPKTAILMGHARGAICLSAAQHALPMVHIEPTRVKKIMTGNGRANKSQMQLAVTRQLQLSSVPDPPDIADALAVAIAGLAMNRSEYELT